MLFNEALMRDINEARPEPGQCAFWWLGQMGLVVKTATKTLCFDLFLSDYSDRRFPAPLQAALMDSADLVFGSHDHLDHIDDGAWRAIAGVNPDTKFVLPAGLAGGVSKRLGIPPERLEGVSDGETRDIDGVTVQAIAAAHERLNDRNENAAFVARVDGLTICHLGDTCVYDGLIARLKAVGPIDILMLPINGRDALRLYRNCIGNMTWQEAVDLVGEVQPKLAIPGHYEMIEGNTEDPMRFAAYLEIKYPERDFWVGPHARQVVYPMPCAR